MGWSNYDHYSDDWSSAARSGESDEYYTTHCTDCDEVTEHDVCTDECVEC